MNNNFFHSNGYVNKHEDFADPFLMPSMELLSDDIRSTYDLCLYLYKQNPIYGAAMNRLLMYFAQDFKIENADETSEVAKKLRRVLTEAIQIIAKCQEVGIEWSIYGNCFIRVVHPFTRWLIDNRDNDYKAYSLSSYPQQYVRFNLDSMTYTVPDRKAASAGVGWGDLPTVELPFADKSSATYEDIRVTLLDPRYVYLDTSHHTKNSQIFFRPPPEMVARIREGNLNEVNNTPRGLLEVVKQEANYLFTDGEVFHFKAPTPSGVSASGLGCPTIIWHFDTLYMLQVYRKADVAIARDFIHPMRVFSPNTTGVQDATQLTLLSNYTAEMKRMVVARRKDPTSMHVLPFPVNYNEYGGNAKQFTTFEQVKLGEETLLDGIGVPRELFRGSMQLDQIPTAMKLMEAQYAWLWHSLNSLVQFISRKVAAALEMGDIYASLKRPTVAYDIENLRLRTQLAANREIPRSAVYPEVGVSDPIAAAVEAVREDHEIQRQTEQENQKQQKAMTQGSMADVAIMAAEQGVGGQGAPAAPGGAPSGGGLDYSPHPGEDPLRINARAEEIAMQWLQMHAQQPNSHRKEMANAEAINPTLYAVASKMMDKMRSQAESQGRSQLGRQ